MFNVRLISHPRKLLGNVLRLAGIFIDVEQALGDVTSNEAVVVIIHDGLAMDRSILPQLDHRAGLSDWVAQMMSDAQRHRALQDSVRVGRRVLLHLLLGIPQHDVLQVTIIPVVVAAVDRS